MHKLKLKLTIYYYTCFNVINADFFKNFLFINFLKQKLFIKLIFYYFIFASKSKISNKSNIITKITFHLLY